MFFQSSDEEVEVELGTSRSMEKVVLITNFYRWLVLNSNVCFLVLILMRSREKVLLCLSPALCRAPLCTIQASTTILLLLVSLYMLYRSKFLIGSSLGDYDP